MTKRKTNEEFIAEATAQWGDRFDFSKTQYINNRTKVCIVCKKCGFEFWMTPQNILYGHGCPKCVGRYKTTEEVVNKFKKIWGDKYDYSLVDYKNSEKKVAIVCREHGVFQVKPNRHLHGGECPICSKAIKIQKLTSNTEEFILKAKAIHKNDFDYSAVEYKDAHTSVAIRCNTCGKIFMQTPNVHLNGHGCPYCTNCFKPTTEEFIEKAKKKFGDRYIYDKVVYKDSETKIDIICPKCGKIFRQYPYHHMQGCGCPFCNGGIRYTRDIFVEKANKKYHNKYDYTNVDYVNSTTKVLIICHEKDENGMEHGGFWQRPNDHLTGKSCPKCALELLSKKQRMSNEDFIAKANVRHHNKYNYSRVNIKKNNRDVVEIGCPIHGFYKQVVCDHLRGFGCPKCNQSKLEIEIDEFLSEKGISFEYQKRFKWLGQQSLDFYLPDYNVGIECQGVQHYRPISFGCKKPNAAEDNLVRVQKLDIRKKQLCDENNVKLIYYSHTDLMEENDMSFHTQEKLLEYISQQQKKEV